MMSRVLIILILLLACARVSAADWGITADFANRDRVQSEYEAAILARSGVNSVFLTTRGRDYNWPNWVAVQGAMNAAGIRCYWDIPTTVSECERFLGFEAGTLGIDDQPVDSSGKRFYFKSDGNLGDFFTSKFDYQTQRVAKALARRLRAQAGFRITSDVDLGDGSYGAEGLASWQSFLKAFFKDDSPSHDSNGDTATFDSSFGVNCKDWGSTPQFSDKDLMDPRKRGLVNMWLADSYAGYVEGVCEQVHGAVNPSSPVGAGIGNNLMFASALASCKNVNQLYAVSPDHLPALACVAAAFGKPVLAEGIKLINGDLAASEQRALKILPYASGITFDYMGLVRARGEGKPAKISKFDPAFQVIPELAPFAGRFRVGRPSVLWITPDREEITNSIDVYSVAESALALDPKCIDLTRFKAVIYQSDTPCASLEILQKLFDYALKGGVVYIDAYRVGNGLTLHGRDNKPFWWDGMKPAGKPGYMIAESARLEPEGEIRDSDGVRYPMLFVRGIGTAGKWVFMNGPDVWDVKLQTLRDIVRKHSGIELTDPSEPRVYFGDGCVLAIGGESARFISIPWQGEKAAVFDVIDHQGAVVEASNGRIELPGTLEPGKAKLWVVKPYGEPVTLYTDGTLDNAASIDGGKYDGKTLALRFAESAFISSPVKPKSVSVGGKDTAFDYDATRRLLIIHRTGETAEMRVEYGG